MKKSVLGFMLLLFIFIILASSAQTPQGQKRPMTFMDVLNLNSIKGGDFSCDKQYFLYEISSLNWEENKRFSDLYLVSALGGPSRQMTFTKKKNETSPQWHPASSLFAFLSDRNDKNQVYFMRPDGGEAWQVTDARDGVISFDWNKDGRLLAFLSGKDKNVQVWTIQGIDGKPSQLTKHETPVESWFWSPDGEKIYFIASDRYDETEKKRDEKGFDAKIINPSLIARHLWVVDLEGKQEKKLTSGESYSVESPVISDGGQYVAFIGCSMNRFADDRSSEVYLLDLQSGKAAQIAQNYVAESSLSFSPDGRWLAFVAPEEFTYMRREKIYLYPLQGGKTLILPQKFDLDADLSFWSDKGDIVFFNTNDGTTYNLFAVPCVEGAEAIKLTNKRAQLFARKDKDTRLILISYSNPYHPVDYYLASMKTLDQKEKWIQLTDANAQVKNFSLSQYENITWKSSDGKMIEGILVYPLNCEKGVRYPLIVQIHGGPAGSYVHCFSGSYGTYTQVFAANGYAVFQPNYRGSSGYGEKSRMEISGDYFRQAFDDIMSGVDYLIEHGIADPDKLGIMGWSAGGHWSNWALVSTDRFKAISTGAGAVNWISLYAQTDEQDTREFYFKGMPYDNWDNYVRVSPLKYIKRAKTPTLIHFGEKDQRIPMPQGEELHMALKKLGVPTEFIVYPGMPHGLTNPRYQLVKMEAEFSWFEKWIKGKKGWLDWKELLKTLPDKKEEETQPK